MHMPADACMPTATHMITVYTLHLWTLHSSGRGCASLTGITETIREWDCRHSRRHVIECLLIPQFPMLIKLLRNTNMDLQCN